MRRRRRSARPASNRAPDPVVALASTTPRRASRARPWSPDRAPWPYLTLPLLLIAALLGLPVLRIFWQSVHHVVLTAPWEGNDFVGAENFLALVQQPAFLRTLQLTVVWTTCSVGVKLLIGLGGALLLQRPFPGRKVYLALLLLPWVTPAVIAAISWRWVLDGQSGWINAVLLVTGAIREPISFLGQETPAFIATVVVDAWLGIPFMVVTLMAGLQRIPDDTIEAARIDGAKPLQIFRRITLPLLRPVLMTCVLLSTVWTFNSFQVIWPLTKGGPAGATATLPIQIYETAFGNFDFGTSSAMAVVIFVILMSVSLLYWRVLKGGEE